tara:strand:+ start:145 stop:1074 length:930 start_codon:yes stop_codon:yes gene_type:complete
MAINVNQVYQTVLLILNKEQRGYLTPDEFNKLATQVQLEIFESYFEDLNQQLRVPDNDSEYGDRIKNTQEKIALFQESGTCPYVGPYFSTPTVSGTTTSQTFTTTTAQQYVITSITADELDAGQPSVTLEDGGGVQQPLAEFIDWTISGTTLNLINQPTAGRNLILTVNQFDFYKIGTVIYKDDTPVQYVQPNELLELNLSPITKPSVTFPVYKYKDRQIFVYPNTINSDLSCTYLRKPLNPMWNFTAAAPSYQYVYNPASSVNFELHPVEQTEIILRILMYAGVIVKDPQLIQSAGQQVAMDNQNEKI